MGLEPIPSDARSHLESWGGVLLLIVVGPCAMASGNGQWLAGEEERGKDDSATERDTVGIILEA